MTTNLIIFQSETVLQFGLHIFAYDNNNTNKQPGTCELTFVYVLGKIVVNSCRLLGRPSSVRYIVVFLSKPIFFRNSPTSMALKQFFFTFDVVTWHIFVPNISLLKSTAMNRPCDAWLKAFNVSSTESTSSCNLACNWRTSNTTIHEIEFLFFNPSIIVMFESRK